MSYNGYYLSEAGCSSMQACQSADDYVSENKRMKQQIVKLSQGLA